MSVCVLQREEVNIKWLTLVWVHVCYEKKWGKKKIHDRVGWRVREGVVCFCECVRERESEWASERGERWNRNKAVYRRDFNTHCAILPTPSITVLWPQQHCVCVCMFLCVCVCVLKMEGYCSSSLKRELHTTANAISASRDRPPPPARSHCLWSFKMDFLVW